MATLRVAVVAESPVLRAGLRALLAAEPGVVVVGALGVAMERAGDEGAAPSPLALVASLDADVVVWATTATALLTLSREDDVPDEAAAGLPALVVLVERVDVALARRAMTAGARSVLPLDAGESTVVAAVQAAAAGLLTLPRELALALRGVAPVEATGMAAARIGMVPGVARVPLTAREREVLALLAQGLANKQIAPRLGITEHTVKAHVAAIYEKVGAGNRAEATVAAARLGLLLL